MEYKTGTQTIMIVDDDKDIRDAIAEVLERDGYKTIGASNGQEACELLQMNRDPPALILLDLLMPIMCGWQFLESQKSAERSQTVPIVVITAAICAEQKARNMGAVGWLKKPTSLEALLSTVQEHSSKIS